MALANFAKVCVVTGAASGIGEAVARLFVSQGAKVVIADIQKDKGSRLVDELGKENAAFVHCDVSNEGQMKQAIFSAINHFGTLDIMVNNAGVMGSVDPIWPGDADDFLKTLDVNLKGCMLGTKHAARAMVERAIEGAIVNTASVAGMQTGLAPAAYSASKAGIISLTQHAAVQLAPFGIRVNAVAPTNVPTAMTASYTFGYDSAEAVEDMRAVLEKASPQHRSLRPEDVANAIFFLASDQAKGVNGHTLVVDNGLSAGCGAAIDLPPGRVTKGFLAEAGKTSLSGAF